MAGPSVVVERAPDGWTHIGGPSMDLLIALDEEDDRTLAASDAADGDDLDDVIEVLTAGGMRKARHFVGVHRKNGTRIVAFGPVVAIVTDADGRERDVRSTSARVWTDLELDGPPQKVVIRVLDETEQSQPAPPETIIEAAAKTGTPRSTSEPDALPDAAELGAAGASPPAVAAVADAAAVLPTTPTVGPEVDRKEGHTPQADQYEPSASVEPPPPATPPTIPTFGAPRDPAASAGPGSRASASPWGRSWAKPAPVEPAAEPATPATPIALPLLEPRPDVAAHPPPTPPTPPSEPATEPAAAPPPQPPLGDSSGSGLPRWGSHRPIAVAGAPAAPTTATGAHDAPAAPKPTASTRTGSEEPVEPNNDQGVEPTIRERRPEPVNEPVVAPTAPERVATADRLVADAPVDVESTWRPSAEPAPATPHPVPVVADSTPAKAPPAKAVAPEPEAGSDEKGPPSYDYLFGHTVAADEHRRFLADLEPTDDDGSGGPGGASDVDQSSPDPAATAVQTSESPAPTGGSGLSATPSPTPATAGALLTTTSGGLISSVPWASSPTPAPATTSEPGAEADAAPTFGGRRTPPPAPSLLPNNPPPAPAVSTSASFTVSRPPPEAVPAPAPAPVAAPPATPESAPPSSFANPDVTPAPAQRPVPSEPSDLGADDRDDDRDDHRDDAGRGSDQNDDGLTIDRSALTEARHAAQQSGDSGPTVLAVLCSAGHPTPPHGECCRACGAGIPAQDPFTMPRPPLGVLRLSTGDVVSLDRSVLLGRAPKLDAGLTGTDRPHVVKVPSPQRDVSRNHVEVVLEGWHVLIRDLGTTNGTTVALPGDHPVRLRANDQQVLEPGSLVSMADEITFTFEAGESP
ncbi:MAG: FHA domain-containing protein [Terracoccus sp.]